MWVALCCAVPLVALAAVLLFDAPTLPISLAAFAALVLIAPRLLGVASAGSGRHAGRSKPGPEDRAGQP